MSNLTTSPLFDSLDALTLDELRDARDAAVDCGLDRLFAEIRAHLDFRAADRDAELQGALIEELERVRARRAEELRRDDCELDFIDVLNAAELRIRRRLRRLEEPA